MAAKKATTSAKKAGPSSTKKRKSPAAATKKDTWVDDLISNARSPRTDGPSEEAIARIEQIMEFNDRQSSRNTRISMSDTVDALKKHHNYQGGVVAFRNWFKAYFDRGWEA